MPNRFSRALRISALVLCLIGAAFSGPARPDVRKEAYLDIGSGSTKLILLEFPGTGESPRIQIFRKPVVFKKSLTTDGRFPPEIEEQGLTVLSEFAATARREGAALVFGGATSVFRTADPEYVRRLLAAWSEKTGWKLKVLTPEEEALAGYRAITLLHPEWKEAVALDMGGGSLQLMMMEDGRFVSRSFPWGAVDVRAALSPEFRRAGTASAVQALGREILKSQLARSLRPAAGRAVVAIGGVAFGLEKVLAPPDRRLTREALLRWAAEIAPLTPAEVEAKYPTTAPYGDEMWSNAVAILAWMQILDTAEITYLDLETGAGLGALIK